MSAVTKTCTVQMYTENYFKKMKLISAMSCQTFCTNVQYKCTVQPYCTIVLYNRTVQISVQSRFIEKMGYLTKFLVVDNLPFDHVGLPHVPDPAVHLVHLSTWIGLGGHPETFSLLALFP